MRGSDQANEPRRNKRDSSAYLPIIAGFSYTFFNHELRNYSQPAGFDEFSGDIKDIIQPLVFQPGEGWEYGVNIDWAGVALQRVTGMPLNDYCHKNIFEPLGLKNISMFPTEDMKKRLAFMNHRKSDGSLVGRDHLLRKPLVVDSSEVKNVFNSGGAGAFSTPSDYARKFFPPRKSNRFHFVVLERRIVTNAPAFRDHRHPA